MNGALAPGAMPPWLGWLGVLLVTAALWLATFALLTSTDSPLHRAFRAHAAKLDAQCRLLYLQVSGERIARVQLGALGALALLAFVTEAVLPFAVLGIAVAVGPGVWLARAVAQRRGQVEQQLDTFLTTLANALRTTPSIGEALATTASLVREPLRQDLEFALKEHRLGAPFDRALVDLAARLDSRTVTSALATLLIGRQTGGDLSSILERSASALREMARLDGVVRAKTAEGRAQATVLAFVPFAILAGVDYVDPDWLKPLRENAVGWAVLALAGALWVGSIVATRRILDVDV